MATLSFPLTPEMGQPLPFSNIRGLTSDKQVVSQLKFTPPSLDSASCRSGAETNECRFIASEPTTLAYRRRSASKWHRAVGLSRDKDIQWSAGHGQTTAVTNNFSGEIAQQQCKFILQEISYRAFAPCGGSNLKRVDRDRRYSGDDAQALEQQIADREGVSPDQIILGEILDSLGLQVALGGGAGGEFIYYRALVDAVALIVGIPLNAHLENDLPSQSSTQTMRETEPDL
jgi:hypothetical protein